jgi:hypothetical protein
MPPNNSDSIAFVEETAWLKHGCGSHFWWLGVEPTPKRSGATSCDLPLPRKGARFVEYASFLSFYIIFSSQLVAYSSEATW